MTICGPNNVSLTPVQLQQYAVQAGFQGDSVNTITAIALAESGGETGNCNLSDPYGGSFGVLQINGSHFLSGTTSKACAFDPLCSFQFAYSLSGGGKNFTPWGSFTDGRYASYLSGLGAGPSGGANLPPNPVTDFLNSLTQTGGALNAIYQWLTDPIRIIKMVVGVILVGISVAVLFVPVPDKLQSYVTTIRKAAHPIARTKKAISPPPAKSAKTPKSSGGKPKP